MMSRKWKDLWFWS